MLNFSPLVAEIGSVTARHSSSGHQPNFAALNRGRHLGQVAITLGIGDKRLDILWCSVCLSLSFVTFFVKKYFFSAYQL